MRGQARCRVHRDDELGPRGAGAPPGNLNALKHGHHSHPLSQPDLERLADQVLQSPDDLPYQVGLAAQSLHARAPGPFATLLALRLLLDELADLVAARLLVSELQALLDVLPPELHRQVHAAVTERLPRRSPIEVLRFLRQLRNQLPEQSRG